MALPPERVPRLSLRTVSGQVWLVVLTVLIAGCTPNGNRERTRCSHNMQRIGQALAAYALKYNAIPLNASGKPAVEQLACSHWSAPDCLPPEDVVCPLARGAVKVDIS
jgi:hypothetical protein